MCKGRGGGTRAIAMTWTQEALPPTPRQLLPFHGATLLRLARAFVPRRRLLRRDAAIASMRRRNDQHWNEWPTARAGGQRPHCEEGTYASV